MDEITLRIKLEGDGGATTYDTVRAPRTRTPPAAELPENQRTRLPGADKKPSSAFDSITDLIAKFRGILGGTFGSLAVATLEVVAALHKLERQGTTTAKAVEAVRALPPQATQTQLPEVLPADIPEVLRTQPPPPAAGMKRFYHGGQPYEGNQAKGPRWLSEHKAYAQAYADKQPGGKLHYVDLPETHPLVEANKAFDDTGLWDPITKTGMRSPTANFEAPEDIAKGLKPYEPPAPAAPTPAAQPAAPAASAIPEALPAEVPAAEAAGTEAGGIGLGAAAGVGVAVQLLANKIRDAGIAIFRAGADAAASIAHVHTDPAAAFESAGDAASGFGKELFILQPELGLLAIAAGETTSALGRVMHAFDETAKRYGEYNPQIAQAQAFADIREVMGDFRRSSEVGNEMARYIAARSELQQRFEEVKIDLLKRLLPIVTDALERISAGVEWGEKIATLADAQVQILSELAKGPLADFKKIAENVDRIANIMKKNDVPVNPIDPTRAILAGFIEPGGQSKIGQINVPNAQVRAPRTCGEDYANPGPPECQCG